MLRSILLLISLSNKQGVRGFPRNIHKSSCITSTHSLVWCIEDTCTKSILMNYTRMFQFGGGLAYSKRSSILTLKSTSPDFVLISLSLSKSNAISQSLAQTSPTLICIPKYNIPPQQYYIYCHVYTMHNVIIILLLYNSYKQMREAIHIALACGAI